MLPPTLIPPQPSPSETTLTTSPTYGDLMTRATSQVEAAQHATSRPFPDAATAHAELLGYERFLHVAGLHLQLLAGLARNPSTPLRKLAGYLVHLQPAGDPRGRWDDAASLLGTAHDVLATHLQDGLLPRTPQAEERLTPSAATRASREVTALVLDAASTRPQLVRSALRSQRNLPRPDQPITKAHANHLAKATSSIEVYTMAALWGLDHGGPSRTQETLGAVTPAPTRVAQRSPAFTRSLEALQILRQLVYDQARGATRASPASLRDLALLGARFTEPGDSLPMPRTGLERVQRAHALDALETAHSAWLTASRDLTTVVQGVTKAPGVYGAAIHTLLRADPEDPALQSAVFAALPRLGRDAGQTIGELGQTGSLLTPQRDVTLRRAWKPLPDQAIAELAQRFRAAGQATDRARHAAQQVARPIQPESADQTAPMPHRSRQQHLAVQR